MKGAGQVNFVLYGIYVTRKQFIFIQYGSD